MTNKTRDRLTTVMDIVVAGLLALGAVAVVDSWWVGAAVFGMGVMWVLRPKGPRVKPAQDREYEKDDFVSGVPFCDSKAPFGGFLTYRPWIDDD